jgi:hypothetical protein
MAAAAEVVASDCSSSCLFAVPCVHELPPWTLCLQVMRLHEKAIPFLGTVGGFVVTGGADGLVRGSARRAPSARLSEARACPHLVSRLATRRQGVGWRRCQAQTPCRGGSSAASFRLPVCTPMLASADR